MVCYVGSLEGVTCENGIQKINKEKNCLSMEHRKHAYFDLKFKPDKGEGGLERGRGR